MHRLLLPALLLLSFAATAQSNPFASRFPVWASANGHYLVDQQKQPFLYQADTPWLLFYSWTKPEVDEYLKVRREQGFSVVQVQLLLDNYAIKSTDSLHPLNNTLDLANRNEAFFAHVDWCIRRAAHHGLAVMIAPAWLSCCVPGWHNGLRLNGADKARAFGQFIGRRYRHEAFPNVLGWIHGGDSNPNAEFDEVQALAEGIQAEERTYPRLHTAHWGSPYSTRDQAPAVSWLNLNATYTYEPMRLDLGLYQNQIYANALRDYGRVPAQPAFLIESDYETPDSAEIAAGAKPHILRRQAWWSVLSGSTGFAYGSANCCGLRPDWRAVLQMPVVNQMRHMGTLLTARPWHRLVPDGLPDPTLPANHRLIVADYGTFYPYPGRAADMGTDYIVAAATPDKKLLIAYVPPTGTAKRSFMVDLSGFTQRSRAHWLNPVTGQSILLPGLPATRQTLTTSGDNGSEQNDWVLVVE